MTTRPIMKPWLSWTAALTLTGAVACAPGPENKTAESGADKQVAKEETPTDPTAWLQGTTWPPKFQATFTNYADGESTGPGTIQYDASDPSNIKMKTEFQWCPPLPCVDPEWVQQKAGCTFYLLPDEELGFASYVFTNGLDQEEYAFIGNMGPLKPDFMTNYYNYNPLPPQGQPGEGWSVPVGNPVGPGAVVEWFLTSGLPGGHPAKDSADQGFYAVVAEPQTEWNGQYFKPPYAFGGTAPFGHGSVHGELAYDWSGWDLDPDFGPIELPSFDGYTQDESDQCPICLPALSPVQACMDKAPSTAIPALPVCQVCHSSQT